MKDIPHYEDCLDFQDLVIETEVVEKVAKKLLGSNGLTGVDEQTIATWLLKFRRI